MKLYAEQVFSPESDIVWSEEAVEPKKVFVKKMSAIPYKRGVNSWIVRDGPVSMQKFTGI